MFKKNPKIIFNKTKILSEMIDAPEESKNCVRGRWKYHWTGTMLPMCTALLDCEAFYEVSIKFSQ